MHLLCQEEDQIPCIMISWVDMVWTNHFQLNIDDPDIDLSAIIEKNVSVGRSFVTIKLIVISLDTFKLAYTSNLNHLFTNDP